MIENLPVEEGREGDLLHLLELTIYHTLYIERGRNPYVSGGKYKMEIVTTVEENDGALVAKRIHELLEEVGLL